MSCNVLYLNFFCVSECFEGRKYKSLSRLGWGKGGGFEPIRTPVLDLYMVTGLQSTVMGALVEARVAGRSGHTVETSARLSRP